MASPCRFCLENDQTDNNPFIQPCKCKGSVKNVHLQCMIKWRAFTENPVTKIKCQLCAALFIFPTRWLMQVNMLRDSIVWSILQNHYILLFLTQWLHFYTSPTNYIQYYTTPESKHAFQLLLVGNATLYLGFYMYQFSNVSEKRIYWRYACIKQRKIYLLFILLSVSYIGTFLHLLPFSYIFITFLPHIIIEHETILSEMNRDCQLL